MSRIRAGFWEVPLLTPLQVSQAFNTCTPADAATAAYVTGLVYGWAGGAAEDAYPGTSPATPVHWACSLVNAAPPGGVAAFQALINVPGQCLNITGTGEGEGAGQGQGRPRSPRGGPRRRELRRGGAPEALPLDTNVRAPPCSFHTHTHPSAAAAGLGLHVLH